jgi:hypothetical protein
VREAQKRFVKPAWRTRCGAVARQVIDFGDLKRPFTPPVVHANSAIKHLAEVASWIEAISDAVHLSSRMGLTVLLGGDHSVAAGSLAGLARSAQESEGNYLFCGWTLILTFTPSIVRAAEIFTAFPWLTQLVSTALMDTFLNWRPQ